MLLHGVMDLSFVYAVEPTTTLLVSSDAFAFFFLLCS
jgi:hypothetical protein